ncbi:ADP-ribosylglycohydrolase family protein [Nocardia pseudobrasiliensis]|uniref:ADP-ribosylglycohydrolase n=1 Tax=Nocardia pseudobrasiliensis TaxID=45979 RepID=A0A370I7S7_9NOCA|nr:ADP-ribosylglycohydrolase family protein [Nocardia pseudobrasiliensis]RDI66779.1 ADP-ribosylglycohydrolase [Nocardia pseudobrasiliensis]
MHDYEKSFDRVRGVLLGGAVGDALGWPIEFLSLNQIRERFGAAGMTDFAPGRDPSAPQQITDDTQMTLFTAEALLRCPPGADPVPVLLRAYLRWLTTQSEHGPGTRPDGWLASLPFLYAARSPGNACISGLRQQQREFRPPHPFGESGPVNAGSKGCGTVMRAAPFGLAGLGPQGAFDLAARGAQLTHGHPTAAVAAGAFAALVDLVVSGVELPNAVRDIISRLANLPAGAETADALKLAVIVADSGAASPEHVEQVGEGWVAEECLAIAVYSALYAQRTGDVSGGLLLSVNHSGDSDSTGAVAGNLIGAIVGLAGLPGEWVAVVEGRDELIRMADDLVLNFVYRDRADLDTRHPLDTAVGSA